MPNCSTTDRAVRKPACTAAASDPDRRRRRRDLPDEHRRRRARDPGGEVMLGQPGIGGSPRPRRVERGRSSCAAHRATCHPMRSGERSSTDSGMGSLGHAWTPAIVSYRFVGRSRPSRSRRVRSSYSWRNTVRALSSGTSSIDDRVEIDGEARRSQSEAIDARFAPLDQPIGELAGRPDDDECVRLQRDAVEVVESSTFAAAASAASSPRSTTRSANTCSGGPVRSTRASDGGPRSMIVSTSRTSVGGYEHDVGTPSRELEHDRPMSQEGHERLTLRRPRRDRRAPDREPPHPRSRRSGACRGR